MSQDQSSRHTPARFLPYALAQGGRNAAFIERAATYAAAYARAEAILGPYADGPMPALLACAIAEGAVAPWGPLIDALAIASRGTVWSESQADRWAAAWLVA